MRILYLVLLMAIVGLISAYDIDASVLEPAGNVAIYNDTSFNVSVNVSCGPSDCGDVNVTLMAARAPQSCQDIFSANPSSPDGIYFVCPTADICRNVYCDMTDGGWASIFTLNDSLTLTDRNCIMHNFNDDMDSVILWTDLTGRVATSNQYSTTDNLYFTWNRDGSENMTADYLPDQSPGLGSYARPVPLPAASKTIWFDWQNERIVWDGGSAAFSDVGLDTSIFGGTSYGNSFYAISDGVNMIHIGSQSGTGVRLLKFDFFKNTVTGQDATYFNPGVSWNTEEDAFHRVLYTVNGRVMYFYNYFAGNSSGDFRLGGSLSDPNSQITTYNVPAWSNPWQPDLDFFTMVDDNNTLWFGDWGHDNGGYFDCGNDEFLGIGKTNIMLTYGASSGAISADPVSETSDAVPFYTTDSNPQTYTLDADESAVANYTVYATEPGTFFFYAIANETSDPFLSNQSESWSVKTYKRVPPTPVQDAPKDNQFMYTGMASLNFSCDNGIIDTVQLWSDLNGTWEMEYSNSSYSEGNVLSVNVDAPASGNYSWAVWCNATYGGEAWSANRTIRVVDSGIFNCKDINDPGTYTLITDVNATSTSNCFNIYANDVVLDCDGHSIFGNGCTNGISGVYSTYLNTTVRNCNISRFCNAIYFNSGSGNGLIENNNLTDSNYGVDLAYSDFNSVLNNNFEHDSYGFYLYQADNNQIGRNNLTDTSNANFGSGSCPFLYLDNGRGYQYYTDLAGESIGASWFETPLYQSGIYELGNFSSTGGKYRMKVREVIPESDFFDMAKLIVVDVPEGYGVLNQWHNTYSDNVAPPKDFMTIKDPRKPVSAVDRKANDVLAEVDEKDGTPLPAYSAGGPNSVIVDFGAIDNPQYAKLVITGWSSYVNNPSFPSMKNLKIETLDENGKWKVAKLFGKFTGDSRTYVFDISGILKADDTRMRITAPHSKTTVNVIDQILLDDSAPVDINVTYIDPSLADLHWGGSTNYTYATAEHRHIVTNEQLPNREDYLMYGNFTKYGDVTPLLGGADDKFAIMRHGDELAFEFPDIPKADGKDRYVFLDADVMYSIRYSVKGYVSDSIEPLPFHGMSKYPYGGSESYPYDKEHLDYIRNWNTRAYEPPAIYGGSLPYSFNNTVFENTFIGGQYSTALYLDHEVSTSLLDNNISGVEIGMELYNSNNTLIRGNIVSADYSRAIQMYYYSDNNTIISNTFTSNNSANCYPGTCSAVYLSQSNQNLFNNNSLNGISSFGIYMTSSSNNTVTNNSIVSSIDPRFALYLTSGSSDNWFLNNSLRSDYWVFDEPAGNAYSDSLSGNIYYTANGTGAWDIFQIYDSNSDGWSDWGSDLPFDCNSVGGCGTAYGFWEGAGEDQHPYTLVVQQPPVQSSSGGESLSRLSAELDSSCDGNVVTATSGIHAIANVHVYVSAPNGTLALGNTDANGELSFPGCGMKVRVSISKSGYLPYYQDFDLAACESCGGEEVIPQPGCAANGDCQSDKMCINSECVPVSCACGTVQEHSCLAYRCCSDSECAVDEICTDHSCVKKPAEIKPECVSDSDCSPGLECKDGKCTQRPAPPTENRTQEDATQAISDAESAIRSAKSSGMDTTDAEAKLAAAQDAYAAGDYENANGLADEAKALALAATAPSVPPAGPAEGGAGWTWFIVVLLLIVIFAGGLVWFFFGRGKK